MAIETMIAPDEDTVTLAWSAATQGYIPWWDLSGCGAWVPPGLAVHALAVASAAGVAWETVIAGQLTLDDPMIAGADGDLFAPARTDTDGSPVLVAISAAGREDT